MIPDGIFRIYKLRYSDDDQEHRRLAGRVWIQGGEVRHLEDHTDIDSLLPEGKITPQTERRFKQLSRSGYFQIINEKDISEGHHASEVDPLDVGPAEPEHRFMMTGDGLANPAMVELWDNSMAIDGRDIDHQEAQHIMDEIRSGRLILTPLD
jgi:hypothetical protein